MEIIKSFSIFNESKSSMSIQKKFPAPKSFHANYIFNLLREKGLDPYELGGQRSTGMWDFIEKKCKSVYPNKRIKDVQKDDSRYEEFVDPESVVQIPMEYDAQLDELHSIERKMNFIEQMKSLRAHTFKNKSDEDQFVKDLEKNVHFGPNTFDWINLTLKLLHDELSEHYINGKLNIWRPQDMDYDEWDGYDYPHRYDIVNELAHPDGVYYLSDIEKFIESKYDIKDPHFYEYIIHNQYIEGRYWERVWSLSFDENSKDLKFERDGGKYGMNPTENINHILNIIEIEFKDEFTKSDYEGFPIYIDYYKKVDHSIKNDPEDWD